MFAFSLAFACGAEDPVSEIILSNQNIELPLGGLRGYVNPLIRFTYNSLPCLKRANLANLAHLIHWASVLAK